MNDCLVDCVLSTHAEKLNLPYVIPRERSDRGNPAERKCGCRLDSYVATMLLLGMTNDDVKLRNSI